MKSKHLLCGIFTASILASSALAEANPAILEVSEEVTRGPYLQQGTSTSIIVRWRTESVTDSVVRYGLTPEKLDLEASSGDQGTEHEVLISELTPDQKYYYSIGSSGEMLTEGQEAMHFVTAPPIGTGKPTRLWVLGDSGTGNSRARAVMDAYVEFTGERSTDLWLMLGDNAYKHGSDKEFQSALFDIYPEMLARVVLWSAVGNHDIETDDGEPYYSVYNFPMEGEAGGVPSGTEAYFSFDYGDIHFVSLDSEEQDRSTDGEMLTWLKQDLAENNQKWTIACWHHSPYTKGSHDSDEKIRHIEMRENALPILEAAGVDLVLGGHSHVYERSWLINGFYDTPTTEDGGGQFIDKGNGRQGQDGSYKKLHGSQNGGTVYIVAGSSGHATKWTNGTRELVNPEPHVVMRKSLLVMGSLVIDIDGDFLRTRFLDNEGNVRDSFVIEKSEELND